MAIGKFIRTASRALRGEQGRKLLDSAENAANRAAGDKHRDKIRKARSAANKAFGHDDDGRGPSRRR